MRLRIQGHDERYAVEQCLLSFFPSERPLFVSSIPHDEPGDYIESKASVGRYYYTAVTDIHKGGHVFRGIARTASAHNAAPLTAQRERRYAIKLSFFRAARDATGVSPPWGALTGIRPAGLVLRRYRSGATRIEAARYLEQRHAVTTTRRFLCLEAADAARRVEVSLYPRDVSLYIGIPFCPTRCAYCTFVSHSVEKAGFLIAPFVEALCREIEAVGALCARLRLRPIALYMGGGTPTTLSANQLSRIFAQLSCALDLRALREFSVEAGRPDTLDDEKLAVMRASGVTRISVNPQSMQDDVLRAIGRPHDAQDVLRAVELVRAAGITILNMDLIAGLPEDTTERFLASLSQVAALSPENITLHTLAQKKGAALSVVGARPLGDPSLEKTVGSDLDFSYSFLLENQYRCYYLYRQKFMAGPFENTGWARSQCESLYNICMMEELGTVLALGGGGVTKLVNLARQRIERVFNPKYPYEYLSRFDDVLARKEKISKFYEGFDSFGGL